MTGVSRGRGQQLELGLSGDVIHEVAGHPMLLCVDTCQEARQGCQITDKTWLDWYQIGQICEFFRADFSTIWLIEPTYAEI